MPWHIRTYVCLYIFYEIKISKFIINLLQQMLGETWRCAVFDNILQIFFSVWEKSSSFMACEYFESIWKLRSSQFILHTLKPQCYWTPFKGWSQSTFHTPLKLLTFTGDKRFGGGFPLWPPYNRDYLYRFLSKEGQTFRASFVR